MPDHEGGERWWSVDHLVVDQDAVPTFVEVKRARDTRARREVVAQMLDYAANGSMFWTPEQLRTWFEGDDPSGARERLASLYVPKTSSTSCDQAIFADQASDGDVFFGRGSGQG